MYVVKKFFLTVSLLLFITPSQAFFKAKAQTTIDDFDGSSRVSIRTGGLDCKQSVLCPMIGFGWSSNTADKLIIHGEMFDIWTKQYFNIQKLQININGDIKSFDSIGVTDFTSDASATYSKQGFFLPIEYKEIFKNEKNIKMRLVTDKGSFDGAFTGGKRPSVAEKNFTLFVEELAKQNHE